MPSRGRPADEDQRVLVESLYRRGFSTREIAAHPDVTLRHSRIADIAREYGPLPEVQITASRRAVTLRADGLNVEELAETVRRALESTGRPARIAHGK